MDGFSGWTDAYTTADSTSNVAPSGSTTLAGSSVSVDWFSSNTYAGGTQGDPEQRLYRVYLDDGDGGSSEVDGDGIGVSVHFSGLSAWLGTTGDNAYTLKAYFSTDSTEAAFQRVDVRQGSTLGGPILDTIANATSWGDGGFPTSSSGSATRGLGLSNVPLSEDVLTLTIPVNGGGGLRGTLAAVRIESVNVIPEPGTLVLSVLAGILLVGSRRRR